MASEFTPHDVGLRKPVRARGKALERTADQLVRMTIVGTLKDQLADAGDDWKQNAPRGAKTILEAKEETP